MTHDRRYELFGYFDQPFDLTRMRMTQQVVGAGTVKACGDLFIGEKRKELLQHVSLFALTCGAGKTMLMVSALFAICHEVNARMKYAPRPQCVLWFCKDRALCIQLRKELKEEITSEAIRLCDVSPDVRICDESGDLDKPPSDNDFTVSCPHALWGKKDQVRSDERIMELLSNYDVIIWDECDFAVDQMERLVRLAPHALKFGLSAANIDAKGNVIKRFFVLAGVASHPSVYRLDHCLRPLLGWEEAKAAHYIRPIAHDGFARWDRASLVAGEGRHGQRHSLPGAMATIRAAIHDARQLEFEMKNDPEWAGVWYSPHISVYCSSREEAMDLCEQTNIHLRNNGYLQEDGWQATYVVSDDRKTTINKHNRLIPKAEQRLFHTDGSMLHPFFVAKERYNGRCNHECKRIVFLVDIGVRGVNNWPLAFVVDLKRSGSVSEQAQTLGRLSRLPLHLKDKHVEEAFEYYCHPRWYFPEAGLDLIGEIQEAWNFTTDMSGRLEAAKMHSWSDMVAGRARPEDGPDQEPTAPFTWTDRLQIDRELGGLRLLGQQPTPENIEAIIAAMPGQHSKDRDQFAREHIYNVLTKPDYRRRLIDLTMDSEGIIKPVAVEHPKSVGSYSDEELISRIVHDDEGQDRATIQRRVEKLRTDPEFREYVAEQARKDDKRLFRQVPRLRQLHDANGEPGILDELRNDWFGELRTKGLATYEEHFGDVSKAVNIATSIACGMTELDDNGELTKPPCAENEGPLDNPGYHYEFITMSARRKIKGLAVAWMIRKRQLGGEAVATLYGDVI